MLVDGRGTPPFKSIRPRPQRGTLHACVVSGAEPSWPHRSACWPRPVCCSAPVASATVTAQAATRRWPSPRCRVSRCHVGRGRSRARPPLTVSSTWQWQLQGDLDTSVDADVYDIDLFETSADDIAGLQADGRIVVCYFSAGSYEGWRPDADRFADRDLGETLDGFEDERWLDVRSDTVRAVIEGRLDRAVAAGCDGVEPDNVDGADQRHGIRPHRCGLARVQPLHRPQRPCTRSAGRVEERRSPRARTRRRVRLRGQRAVPRVRRVRCVRSLRRPGQTGVQCRVRPGVRGRSGADLCRCARGVTSARWSSHSTSTARSGSAATDRRATYAGPMSDTAATTDVEILPSDWREQVLELAEQQDAVDPRSQLPAARDPGHRPPHRRLARALAASPPRSMPRRSCSAVCTSWPSRRRSSASTRRC